MRSQRLLLVLAGLLGLGFPPSAAASKPEHGFVEHTYRGADHKGTRYYVFVPYGYKGTRAYPMLVFLHGSGAAGTDPRKAIGQGLGDRIRKQEKTFPFLVVFPQARATEWAADSRDGRRAMAIMADAAKHYRVDPKRLYLTGLSSGGDGTWSFAVKYPERWAAIVPVCGNGDPRDAGKIKDIPCWYFMGAADNPAWVANARAMVQALREAGGHPLYTEYPGMGHGIWNKAYGTPELYTWLWKQHRK